MKLIKRITVEPRKVKIGQPFKVKVLLNKIPDKEIYVQINDRWGTQQIFQFEGLPGKRSIQVRAFTDDKRVYDFRQATATLLPEQQSESRGSIQPEVYPQIPTALRLNLLRPPLMQAPSDVFYEWYINGQKMATQREPEGFFDLSSQINHRQMFTEFEVKLVERKENGTTSAKYRQFVSLASSYHLIKKQAGVLIPPVENDFLLDVAMEGFVYFNFFIQNVENYSLTFKTAQIEFLNNDPQVANVFREETFPEYLVVPAAAKKRYDNALKLSKLPPNTGGFIVRLLGVSETGIPVKSVAHFEFALQMRHLQLKYLEDSAPINRWPWEERPWEIVLRRLAEDYFIKIPAVQNGKASISLLKRLYSTNIQGIKNHLVSIQTGVPAIAGVEITDSRVNAVINQLAAPTVSTNLAASQQLYQSVFRLRTLARSAAQIPGRREAIPAGDGNSISPETLEALRDFKLEALVPSEEVGTASSMSRNMEGAECQPDEEAPVEELICQLTHEIKNVAIPAKIVNARKGDIILAPGGPGGFVGDLLQALFPPQWYSHCGIMEQNYYRIYHCTASEEWLRDHPDGADLPFDGEDALPLDGFSPEAIQYLWPGTVSQTVEEAFNGSMMKESDEVIEVLGIKIPFKEYNIKAFSLHTIFPNQEHPVTDQEKKAYYWDHGRISFPPLVVTIPPDVEAKNPELRQILRRVADQCLKIKGHYAFYAYSDADIAFKPAYFASIRPGWWASGSRPVVCSTLIWAAIRELFAGRGILEGKHEIATDQDLEPADRTRKIKVEVNGQEKEITVEMGGMIDDPLRPREHITKDGLYFYDEAERKHAAQYLKTKLVTDIYDKYNKSFMKLGWEIEFFKGMAQKVSNQFCNMFANGQPSTLSDKWRNPGTGRSVSPDNIKDYWDSPVVLPDGTLHGLYGYYEPLIYRPGRIEQMRVSRWKKKPKTTGKITGKVLHNGTGVDRADIRVGGKMLQTHQDGSFEIELPTGNYRMYVEKFIGGGLMGAMVEIDDLKPGEVRHLDIYLSATKRVLYYYAHAEINDYEPDFWEDDEHVGRDWGTEAAPKFVILNAAHPGPPVHERWVEKMGGEIRVEVEFVFSIRSDLTIDASIKVLLFEGTSEDTNELNGWSDWMQVVIPPTDNWYLMFPPPGQSDVDIWNIVENETKDYARLRFWFKNMVATY